MWGLLGGAIVLGKFQCWGVLLIWITVWQGLSVLAAGAGIGCLDIFLSSIISLFLSPSLWEAARYRLQYRLTGTVSSKQPTNFALCFAVIRYTFSTSQIIRLMAV